VAQLEREAGLPGLVARLRALDPAVLPGPGGGGLDLSNPRRVARALERCLATGQTVAALAAEFYAKPGPFADWQARAVCLTRPDEELRARIIERVAGMLRAGLVDETRRLRAEGIEENPSAASAIGYRETLAMLRGELAAERLADEIAGNTWRLVRKQKTWFRTQLASAEALPHAGANLGAERRVRLLAAAEATVAKLF
jgi:tRNA dimethylallyltransferase